MSRRAADTSVFHAIADPTRRAMLDRLRAGPRTAGELGAGMPMTAAAVSQHLKVVKGAGLVADERVGRARFYRLLPEPLAEVDAFVEHYRVFWPQKLRALGEYLERSHGAES